MKKAFLTLFALGGIVYANESAQTFTLKTSLPGENYNAVDVYGFYLNLSENITSTQTYELTESITLNSFKLEWAHNNNSVGNMFCFSVVDSSNSVLGYSSSETVKNDGTGTFSFTAIDGVKPLTISADTTYRYLAVKTDIIDYISSSSHNELTYSASESTSSINGNVVTGGLVKINGRAYADASNAYNDALWINSADGTTSTKSGIYNLHVRPHSIEVTTVIPEPTAATLSLLALAGLAARRRRASR